MIKKFIILAGGISLILYGFSMMLLQLDETWASGYGGVFILAAWLVGSAGLLLHGRAGRLGRIGSWISIAGVVLVLAMVLLQNQLTSLPWTFFILCFFSILLGFGIYGIAALKSKPLRWGNGLPLLCAVLTSALLFQQATAPSWVGTLLSLSLGVSWGALGYSLILSRAGLVDEGVRPAQRSRTALLGGVGLLACILGLQAFILRTEASRTTCPVPIAAIPRLDGAPRPVIFDADMAHDDMIAGLYLLQHPDIEVKAITVAATGEAHCEGGVRNGRSIAAVHGQSEIPVACGSETPMAGNHEFPAEWRQSADNLYGIDPPENTSQAVTTTASDLIASIIKESPEKVTLVAVGPLTNLGQALEDDPSLADGIEEIFIMGGAVEIGGNVGMSGVGIENTVAEWNIYIDPYAANIVFASGAPVTLVPLNATRHAPVTADFYSCIQENHLTPEAGFVYEILRATYDFIASGGFQFWDTLTAAILTDESLAEFQTMDLVVVEEEGPASGHTRPDRDGYPVRVAVSADGDRFEALLLEVLNGPRESNE